MPKNFDENNHRRKSIRLPHYNYSQNGAYFITICTKNRVCILGEITNGTMHKNELGEMVEKFWYKIPDHFPDVSLGEFVVMPNHIHGIIIIEKPANETVGANKHSPVFPSRAKDFSPLQKTPFRSPSRTIGSVIRGFKIGVTKYTKTIGFDESIWQRNYHEHIIRDQNSFEKITEYIKYNPEKWDDDRFFINF